MYVAILISSVKVESFWLLIFPKNPWKLLYIQNVGACCLGTVPYRYRSAQPTNCSNLWT